MARPFSRFRAPIAAPIAAASLAAVLSCVVVLPAAAATTQVAPKADVHWSFESPLGMYDQAQLQRGYKVYREVCAACHSMNMVAFRNLGDKGGPFWNPKYPNPNDNPVVKSIAADYQVADIDSDTGETIKRPGTSADYFPNPYPNPTAGKAANGGALPPDMSLLAKAREGGPDYIYSIVTGDDSTIPAGLTLPPGKHYDPYIAGDLTPYWRGDPNKVPRGGLIAMPPPLSPGKVQFDDGTRSSVSPGSLGRRRLPQVGPPIPRWKSASSSERGDDLPGPVLRPAVGHLPQPLAQRALRAFPPEAGLSHMESRSLPRRVGPSLHQVFRRSFESPKMQFGPDFAAEIPYAIPLPLRGERALILSSPSGGEGDHWLGRGLRRRSKSAPPTRRSRRGGPSSPLAPVASGQRRAGVDKKARCAPS